MSNGTLAAPLNMRAFLFDDGTGTDTAEVVARTLRERGVTASALHGVGRLSAAAEHSVDREVAAVVDDLLTLDLGDVLVSCWRKYSALTEAARRTLATPGSEEVVALASHEATATYCPYVDLFLDDIKLTTLEFKLAVTFLATGLAAVVRSGNLVAVEGGDCLATATLTLEGAPLTERRMHVDPSLVVNLRRGIPLLHEPADATTAHVPEQRTPPSHQHSRPPEMR